MAGRGRRLAAASTAAAAGITLVGADAQADPRTFEVTVVTGTTVVVTIDVPPGTPLDDVHLPPLDTPVASVRERVEEEEVEPAKETDRGERSASARSAP